MTLGEIVYSFAMSCYLSFIRIAAVFNEKARLWISGRKAQASVLSDLKLNKCIWFHVSSLGEFEQGRNLIECIKKNHPEIPIVLTFFSPSGFEIRKNYAFADHIFYLPSDGKKSSVKFIEAINPIFAIFVKYEFWYFYFKYLRLKNIPVFLISAIFHDKHFLFNSFSGILKKIPSFVTHFFVQDEKSEEFLRKKGYTNVSLAGDTRIDRVLTIVGESTAFRDEKIEIFKGTSKIIIAGSSYLTEEKFIEERLKKRNDPVKYILVPHHVNDRRLKELKDRFEDKAIFYSESLSPEQLIQKNILVVDLVGILNKIYMYADIALIGGGFNKGIHNLLEPVAHQLPVIFGPKNHQKFPEAIWLTNSKSGFLVKNSIEFLKITDFLLEGENAKKTGKIAFNEISSRKGGTGKIYSFLINNFKEHFAI